MKNIDLDLKKLDFQHIALWPSQARYVFIVLVGVLVFIFGFFFFNRPQYQALTRITSAETTTKQSLKKIIPEVMTLQRREANLQSLKKTLALYQRKVPKLQSIEGVLQDLTKLASNNHLNIVLLKPSAATQENDFYAKIPIAFKVMGSYSSIVHFAAQLAALPYYMYPAAMVITPATGEGDGQSASTIASNDLVMNSTIEMFYFSPLSKDKNEKKH